MIWVSLCRSIISNHIKPYLGQKRLTKLTPADLKNLYELLLKSGRIIRSGKGGALEEGDTKIYARKRTILLPRSTVQLLRKRKGSALTEWIFPDLKNTELERSKADMTFGAWMDRWYQTECKPATHPQEMQRLLIQAKENGCYELLLLELSTGLRRGELLALQWDDLDFQTGELRIERQVQRVKGELTVTQPKTKSSIRTVILPTTENVWPGIFTPQLRRSARRSWHR